ncbi:hypothetical protein [Sorangium sp. So ce131]|uniref:hypothetical protein n=1 Tax=Sorangium sp. So ce131 TaxID=3133282 RepID=UPI003F646B91
METSQIGRSKSSTTKRRSARGGAVQGLAGLLGLGLCLGISSASAADTTQASSHQVSAPAAATYAPNHTKRRLIIAGASTLGGFWTASAIYATSLALTKEDAPKCHCTQHVCVVAARAEERSPSPAALLVPLAGPWIHIGTARPGPAGAVALSVLGVGQAVGLGMLIGGVAMPAQVRVPMKHGRVLQLGAAPVVTPGGVGLSIRGSL